MKIRLKRVYLAPEPGDGIRVLVERLWPRGLSRQVARVDFWPKDAAPSTQLRKWFQHDPELWSEFKKRYFSELDARPAAVKSLLRLGKEATVTFLFAAREEHFNNAAALKEYLETKRGIRGERPPGRRSLTGSGESTKDGK